MHISQDCTCACILLKLKVTRLFITHITNKDCFTRPCFTHQFFKLKYIFKHFNKLVLNLIHRVLLCILFYFESKFHEAQADLGLYVAFASLFLNSWQSFLNLPPKYEITDRSQPYLDMYKCLVFKEEMTSGAENIAQLTEWSPTVREALAWSSVPHWKRAWWYMLVISPLRIESVL